MTTADEHYMVDVDDENLLDFLTWHRAGWYAGKFRTMTVYSMLKWAWMAGARARSAPELAVQPLEPLPPRPLRVREGDKARITSPPPPDFILHGTVTGRIPRAEPETRPQPAAVDPDPFASVRLSGPQQAALDSMYPLPGSSLADPDHVLDDMPVVGPVEHR